MFISDEAKAKAAAIKIIKERVKANVAIIRNGHYRINKTACNTVYSFCDTTVTVKEQKKDGYIIIHPVSGKCKEKNLCSKELTIYGSELSWAVNNC